MNSGDVSAVANRWLVLFNPSSGKGLAKKFEKRIKSFFENNFLNRFDWCETKSLEHMQEQSRLAAENYKAVIGIGGDSTFSIIANQLVRHPGKNQVVLGMIGLGSANDIPKSMGIETMDQAFWVLTGKKVRSMDIGVVTVNDQERHYYFLGTLSIGLGAKVNRYIENFSVYHPHLAFLNARFPWLTGLLGVRHAFSEGSLPALADLKSTAFSQEKIPYSLLVFFNTSLYAKGMFKHPQANPFDGELNGWLIHTHNFFSSIQAARQLAAGTVPFPQLQPLNGTDFTLKFPHPLDIQLDGEIIPAVSSMKIGMLPRHLPVFVPGEKDF
jgi:diacylglycerol kinase family enzyme